MVEPDEEEEEEEVVGSEDPTPMLNTVVSNGREGRRSLRMVGGGATVFTTLCVAVNAPITMEFQEEGVKYEVSESKSPSTRPPSPPATAAAAASTVPSAPSPPPSVVAAPRRCICMRVPVGAATVCRSESGGVRDTLGAE